VHACDGYLPEVGCCYNDVLYYCDGSAISTVDCYEESSSSCGYFNAASGGPYFGCEGDDSVDPEYTAECPDNILPECADDAAEPNDTLGTAYAIAFDDIETQMKICPGNEDWFILTDLHIGDNITVELEFLHDEGNLDLYLYDALSALLTWSDTSNSSSNNETLSYTVSTAGDHYILVKGFSGSVANSYTLLVTGDLICDSDSCDSDSSDSDSSDSDSSDSDSSDSDSSDTTTNQ
jgi:hypothetical protein